MTDYKGQRLPISSTRLVIDGENIPFGAYQAIYHRITKKTEKISQKYADAYEIGIENIAELNQRLEQGLKQYQVAGKHCEISHSISGGQSRQFSAFQKFAICDTAISAVSRSLHYELNFLVILPAEIPEAEDIPQRYKVTISIDNQAVDDDEEYDDLPKYIRIVHSRSVTISLEYTDYAVAIAIKSIIDGWITTLPSARLTSTQRWFLKQRYNYSNNFIDFLTCIPFITGIIFLLGRDDASIKTVGLVVLAALALRIVSGAVISLLWQGVESAVDSLLPLTRIVITKGDHSEKDKDLRKAGRILRLIVSASGIALAITVNVLSSAIYERLM